jgi:hypothetical protein
MHAADCSNAALCSVHWPVPQCHQTCLSLERFFKGRTLWIECPLSCAVSGTKNFLPEEFQVLLSPCCHIIKVRMGSRGVYNPYLVLTPHTTTDILRCHTSDRLCLQVTSPTARRRVCPPVFSRSPVAMDLGSSLSFLHHPQSTEPAGSGSLSRRFLEPQSAGWSWPF